MLRTVRITFPALVVITCLALVWPLAAAAPAARPEDVGLSTDRLKRVADLVQRHIGAGSFSGAVTLVARNGRIAYHEAAGLMDLEAKKPMTKDAMFRIMSMTKPVIGVATLMMMEEGKVRLQDPISKFIPEWKDMTVAVPLSGRRRAAAPRQPRRRPGRRRGRQSALLHRSGGAGSHDPRPADAHVGARQRHQQQFRRPRRRRHAEGDAGRLHPAAGQGAAGVSARHAVGL